MSTRTKAVAKCIICGRFRRWDDVVVVDYSDEHAVPLVEECLDCTAPANTEYIK